MAKNGTEFSKYAQAFREVIDGNKTDIDILAKELLKMGLTVNDKNYINEEYPEYIDDNGERHIAGNKGDTLRKYFSGTNDLSRLIPKLETEFDSDFHERYCDELQDYDESRIMAFARVLNIDVNEDDIDIVSEAIANYYSSIVIGSATKKSRKGKKDKNEPAQITYSYTISESEKKEVKNICSLIDESIKKLHKIGVAINGILSTIHNYDNEPKWRLSLWNCLREQTELYNSEYDICSQHCSALANLLKTKVRIKTCIKALYDIANEIVDNKYIASQKDYNLEVFNTMMKKFQDNHKLLLKYIDEI